MAWFLLDKCLPCPPQLALVGQAKARRDHYIISLTSRLLNFAQLPTYAARSSLALDYPVCLAARRLETAASFGRLFPGLVPLAVKKQGLISSRNMSSFNFQPVISVLPVSAQRKSPFKARDARPVDAVTK